MQLVRLQNTNVNSGTNDSCWVYNYYVGTDAPNPTSCVVPTLPTLRNNNGNVMGYYYQDTVNTSLGHTVSNTYDYLNRLTGAAATGSSTYSLGFGYDRWGNMSCTGGDGGGSANGPCPQWTFSSSNQPRKCSVTLERRIENWLVRPGSRGCGVPGSFLRRVFASISC